MKKNKILYISQRIRRALYLSEPLIIGLIVSLVALLFLTYRNDSNNSLIDYKVLKLLESNDSILIIPTIAAALVTLFSTLMIIRSYFRYLNPDTSRVSSSIERTNVYLDTVRAMKNNERMREKFIDEISREAVKNISKEAIAFAAEEELLKKISGKVSEITLSSTINDIYKDTATRILSEIVALTKRANVNLLIGIITTAIALIIISSLFLVNSSPELSTSEIALYFIPRIALSAFLQVFAYFFLRIYRRLLDEIKYFQNELTNLDMRQLGITISILTKEELPATISSLLATERNFLLKKGETTAHLQSQKIEFDAHESSIRAIAEVIAAIKKAS